MGKSDLLLNHVFLKNRIAELGIKQWWLAEQIGVDRKTVSRWLQGQVKAIQHENIDALAKVLQCETRDLLLENSAEQMATPKDQKVAADALLTSSLVDKLGPLGEWNVIESLIKATIIPGLPLNVLGELYDQLTIASWRQSKIDQAAQYCTKTEEIARKTDDRSLLASALLSKANIFSWRGQVTSAIATYRACLDLSKYIDAKKLGAIHSNLGGVLYEGGDLEEGERLVRQSLKFFELEGTPTNHSIAHCHLALIHLQRLEIDAAEKATATSVQYAKADDFRRGLAEGKILAAEVAAHRGHKELALNLVSEGMKDFERLNISEGLMYEQAGRVHRLISRLPEAETLFLKGISIAQDFPVYLAVLYVELALTQKLLGREDWASASRQALALYQKCEYPLRVAQVKKLFQTTELA